MAAYGTDRPQLDPRNAVTLLMSAENWKMDSFVDECIGYIYVHLEEVLCAHANFTGVSDALLLKLAQRFNHNELDSLRDKKDKIKSMLFRKYSEKMFSFENNQSANLVFLCGACNVLLTPNCRWKIRCIPSRMAINRYGELVPLHCKDKSWDHQTFLEIVYSELGSWRRVYWYIWGLFNLLQCSTCSEYFRCCDLGKCRYHPDDPAYRQQLPLSHQSLRKESDIGPFVTYDCCQQVVVRFDPLEINTGCQFQDHTFDSTDEKLLSIYTDLLAHKTNVCVNMDLTKRYRAMNKDLKSQTSFIISGPQEDSTSEASDDSSENLALSKALNNNSSGNGSTSNENGSDDSSSDGSEESIESDGLLSAVEPITAQMRKIVQWKWNPNSSIRHSQDMQREHEQMKMVNLTKRLVKVNMTGMSESIKGMSQNHSTPVNFDSAGGVYARLEAEWKAKIAPKKMMNTHNIRFQKLATGPR